MKNKRIKIGTILICMIMLVLISCDLISPLKKVGPEKVIKISVVTRGAEPDIWWNTGPIGRLFVSPTDDPTQLMWGIITPGRDGIRSPIRYGELQNGVQFLDDSLHIVDGDTVLYAMELQPGTEYYVQAMSLTKDYIGSAIFTIEEGVEQ
ncbi:hypothetical protein KAR48_09600 [bacterium]|nr:hypothetical protein [bacterium]